MNTRLPNLANEQHYDSVENVDIGPESRSTKEWSTLREIFGRSHRTTFAWPHGHGVSILQGPHVVHRTNYGGRASPRLSMCCSEGDTVLPPLTPTPPILARFLRSNTEDVKRVPGDLAPRTVL